MISKRGLLPSKPANTEPKPTWYASEDQIALVNKKVAEDAALEAENLRKHLENIFNPGLATPS